MKRTIERISTAQLTMLAGGAMLGTVFLPISSILAHIAGSDSTIGLIAALAFAMPWAYFVVHPSILAFPRKALTAQFRQAFGGILGPLLALVFGVATIAFAAGLARQIGDVYILSLMPRTPPWVFSLPTVFLSALMAREGVEVLARYCGIVFPALMITLLSLIAVTAPYGRIGNFLPMFEFGLLLPLKAAARGLSYAGEMIVIIWSVLPAINQPRGANRAILAGATAAAVAVIGINFATIGVFSAPEVARLFYATIDLAKMIQSGGYIRGLESIIVAIFSAASVLKVTAFMLAGTRIVADVFRRPDYRPLVIPVAVVCFVGTILLRNATMFTRMVDFIDDYVMLPAFLGVPPVVMLLGRWQQRRKRQKAAKAA